MAERPNLPPVVAALALQHLIRSVMPKTIPLSEGGSAEFKDEYIQIDNKRTSRYQWLAIVSALVLVPASVYFLVRSNLNFRQLTTWLWLVVLLAYLIGGRIWIFRTSFYELIWFDQIASATVTTEANQATLELQLKSGKHREICTQNEYLEDLQRLVSANRL